MKTNSDGDIKRLRSITARWHDLVTVLTVRRVAARGGVKTAYDDGFADGMQYCIQSIEKFDIRPLLRSANVIYLAVDNTQPIKKPRRKSRAKTKKEKPQ